MKRIDFEKELGLGHKVGGFIARITSPKAIRKEEKGGRYSYRFHTDSIYRHPDGTYQSKDGIYQVIDICKWNNTSELQWNIYIVIVEDGEVYPVGEYLDSPVTLWVKDAKKLVKAYFEGEQLDVIELTPQPKPSKTKPSWEIGGYMNPPAKTSKKRKSEKTEEKSEPQKKSEKKTSKTSQKPIQKEKKKPSGRSQEVEPLKSKEVRLMTFTGMVIGVYRMKRHNSKFIEIETDKGVLRFSRETCRQVNVQEGKERYANKIEYKL